MTPSSSTVPVLPRPRRSHHDLTEPYGAPPLRFRAAGIEVDGQDTGGEGSAETDLDALGDHRVDLAAGDRLEAPTAGRHAAGDETPAPGFDVLQRKAVERERLLDQHVR